MRRRGISPVIATVIIVAVAIAIAIAVAFWMTGIVGLFTTFEQVQVVSAYATTSSSGGWEIVVEIKNVGTRAATIDYIFINGRPAFKFTGNTPIDGQEITLTTSDITSPQEDDTYSGTLNPGKSATLKIQLQDTTHFTAGQSVEIKIHTASGKEYPKLVVLP